MSDALQADLMALNDLIVNCHDFDHLEALLGGFNLFQVLKFEHGEIRHSNVLAWILDPAESHGLGATFLKKWLMRVLHEASDSFETSVSPVDIDVWQLTEVEVRREWQNIDLLLILKFVDGQHWVVCIENKINSTQHSNQLHRYRKLVESTLPEASQRLFIFLTKNDETPDDDCYVNASYSQIHQALQEALQGRSNAIGSEPRVLLENYLRLLEERFMDESEIARTAQRIYQQHRRALDLIFEHRPDSLRTVSETVRKLLADNAAELGIRMESSTRSYIRFIPCSWDIPANTHGAAWSGSNRSVIFEMNLTAKRLYLYIIAGKAPDTWINPLWERSASSPFQRPKRSSRPRHWCSLHCSPPCKVLLNDEEIDDPNEVAGQIYDWCVKSFKTPESQEVIRLIAAELPSLENAYSSVHS